MFAIKNKALILEGDRNYSDGLCAIPIYKTSISNANYHAPDIHPGMYPSTTPSVINSLIAKKTKQMPKKTQL